MSETCPKCGASSFTFNARGTGEFHCGSVVWPQSFDQSEECRTAVIINALTAQLAAKTAECEQLAEIIYQACAAIMPGLEGCADSPGRLPSACRQIVKAEAADMDEIKRLQDERSQLRWEVTRLHRFGTGEYWRWQGDGTDHLESLTCPVLIDPKALAALAPQREEGG